MTTFRLTETLNSSLPKSFKSFLYNSKEYLRGFKGQSHYSFFLEKGNSVAAHLTIGIEGELAVSQLKAPFGGIEFSEDLKASELKNWIIEIEDSLKSKGIKELRLHQAPEVYQSQESINAVLSSLEFEVIQERVYHAIPIDQVDLVEKMHPMEQRRLQKAQKAGCEFKAYGKKDLAKVYQQIRRWRDQATKPLSMEWVDLNDASQRNPHAYLAFGIELNGELIAATIAIKVNDTSLYHFFPASYDRYNRLSPMVMLVNGLYDWCQAQGISVLDLGTSYIKSQKKASLVQFKENIGGLPHMALSWRKTLS